MFDRKLISLLFLIMITLLQSACARLVPARQELNVNAKELLVIYTAFSEERLNVYTQLFQQEYPEIELEIRRFDTSWEVAQTLLSQKNNTDADVIWGVDASAIIRLQAETILEPYITSDGSAEQARVERVYKIMRDPNTPPEWIGLDARITAFCVNPQLLTEKKIPMPTSWLDLINPQYQDQIIAPNPNASSVGFIGLVNLVDLFTSQDLGASELLNWATVQNQRGEAAAWAYLDALHKNVRVYTNSDAEPCKQVAAGEVPIGISFGIEAIRLREKEFPVIAVFPAELPGWDVEAVALVKKDNGKPEAKVFIDWALNDRSMQAYAKYYPQISVPTEIEVPIGYLPDPLTKLKPKQYGWATANYDRLVADWLERYESKVEGESFNIVPLDLDAGDG